MTGDRDIKMGDKIPLNDLRRQHETIMVELKAAFDDILEQSCFLKGKPLKEFEAAFAKYCSSSFAVGVSNGTCALELALEACGIGEGDEVILPAHTFVATAEAVRTVGAKVRFADVDEKTYLVTVDTIKHVMTAKTKAILCVHLHGQMCDVEKISEFAKKNDLIFIEDAAQAHGARFGKYGPGQLSDAAAFSFYPGKNLGALGDAGIVVTSDEKIAKKVRQLADHGRASGSKYEHAISGYNKRIDTLQARFLSVKLPYLDMWTEKRQAIARRYDESLKGCVTTPYCDPKAYHVYHHYIILADRRDELCEHLDKDGISWGRHYPIPVHKQPSFSGSAASVVSLPITESIVSKSLTLPLFPEMTDDEVQRVIDSVRSFYDN